MMMSILLAEAVTKKVLDTMNFGVDVLAAIDQAITDYVNLIYVSAGGSTSTNSEEIFTDEISICAFHALARNIS